MIKQLSFSLLCILVSAPYSFAMSNTTNPDTQSSETKKVLKEYRIHLLRLKKLEQINVELYKKAEAAVVKCIQSEAVQSKVKTLVAEQYDALSEQNSSFSPLQQTFNIKDYFPDIAVDKIDEKYLMTLFDLMVKKEYYRLLWQQLTKKEKEKSKLFDSMEQELNTKAS